MKSFAPAEILCLSLSSSDFNVWISGQGNGRIVLERVHHLLKDCSFASHIFVTDIYK